MQLIEYKSSHFGNKPVFKGTRIPVSLILELLSSGETIDNILKNYPQLTLAHIKEAFKISAKMLNYEEKEIEIFD